MSGLPPFDHRELRLDFIRRLGTAAGVAVEDSVADKTFKAFPLAELAETGRLEAAVAALDWFLEASASGNVPRDEG